MAQSDHERNEFYMWIGHCISAWAKVEEQLFKICWQSLRAPKTQAAIVYYRTPSLDARISLVDELVKSALPKPERKNGGHTHASVIAWGKIEAGIRAGLTIRRRIAHHPVRTNEASFPFEDNDSFKGESFSLSWYEIYVSEHENARGKEIAPQNLILTDLVDHDQAVTRLAGRLAAFRADELSEHVPKPAGLSPRRKRDSSKDSPA
jgi:hypothetical protein